MKKKCHDCKEVLPLEDFHKVNPKDYQLPTDLGRVICCKVCTYKRIIKQGEKLHPYKKKTQTMGDVRRFTSIPMTESEAWKYCFDMTYDERREFCKGKLAEQGLEVFN